MIKIPHWYVPHGKERKRLNHVRTPIWLILCSRISADDLFREFRWDRVSEILSIKNRPAMGTGSFAVLQDQFIQHMYDPLFANNWVEWFDFSQAHHYNHGECMDEIIWGALNNELGLTTNKG